MYDRAGHQRLVSAAHRRRRGERRDRVTRWKRAIVSPPLKPRNELPVVRIRTDRVDERTRAAEDVLQHAADACADDQRLGAVQPELGESVIARSGGRPRTSMAR